MAEETKSENQNQVVAFDKILASAKSPKELFANPNVIDRLVRGYASMNNRKDGVSKVEHERSAYLEILFEKPELRGAPQWVHFKVLNKIMHNNWSLRDNRVYVKAVKRGEEVVDIKVDPSPALRRAMMEQMPTIKEVPEAQVVVRGDIFIEDKLNHIILEHKGTKDSLPQDKLENILYSYQRVIYKDGSIKDVVVPNYDLVKAKSKSKIKGDGGVWEFVAEACKKTATNRAFRLYHKYPDNSVVFDDDTVTDTEHEDVTHETIAIPENQDQYIQSQSGEQVDTDTGEVQKAEEPKVIENDKKSKKQYDLLS